jgi:hypothetical protein
MDFVWIANDQGDITGITATTPLTGGGTSGAVTVGIQDALTTQKGAVQLSDSTSTTSSILAATPTAVKAAYDLADGAIAKTTVTTAGDIIYRNATVPVRLGIGTAGQVLTVNSGATAPEWATPASGSTFVGTVLRRSANQSISNTTLTAVAFTQETIDTNGFHDNVTNNTRVTIPSGKSGKYTFIWNAVWSSNSTGYRKANLYLNGSSNSQLATAVAVNGDQTALTGTVTFSATAGDYFEVYVYQSSGGALDLIDNSYFQVYYLGA